MKIYKNILTIHSHTELLRRMFKYCSFLPNNIYDNIPLVSLAEESSRLSNLLTDAPAAVSLQTDHDNLGIPAVLLPDQLVPERQLADQLV